MTTIRQTSPLIPASPFRNGDPPTPNAELTIYQLGLDEDAIIPALRVLGEFNLQQLRRFQGSLPVTITLPATYYARTNAFVSLLRTTGTRFKIKSWAWVCPDELASDLSGVKEGFHWCSATCPVYQVEETVE